MRVTREAIIKQALSSGLALTQKHFEGAGLTVIINGKPETCRTTRLGSAIFNIRKDWVISTTRVKNSDNDGTHGVYRLISKTKPKKSIFTEIKEFFKL